MQIAFEMNIADKAMASEAYAAFARIVGEVTGKIVTVEDQVRREKGCVVTGAVDGGIEKYTSRKPSPLASHVGRAAVAALNAAGFAVCESSLRVDLTEENPLPPLWRLEVRKAPAPVGK